MSAGRRILGVLAAVLAPLALEAQTPADSVQPVILELTVGRYASRTVSALRVADDALVPVAHILELAEIRARPLPGGSVELGLGPEQDPIVLDPARPVVRVRDTTVVLGPLDRLLRDGEQYVATRVLATMLDVTIAVNWTELSVAILDGDNLPVGRRLAREKAHATFRAAADRATPDLALGSERTRWDGVVVDYSLLAPSEDPLGGGAYSGGVGFNVWGGSLDLRVASVGRPRDGGVRTDASWTGVWRESRWITQLQLGDGFATGPRPRSLRGVAISNAPFSRPSLFGDVTFQGALGPGWQIEAYRGGRLIAIDSATAIGDFSLDLPVQYGENPVDFVAYGPFGEMHQFNRTYRVVADMIPERRLEYGLSVGGCRSDACRASGNLDLRYGISRRWTVRGGVEHFWRDTLPGLFHPYLGVSGSIGNAWALEVDGVAAAVVRGALRYEPSQDLRVSTEYNDFATGTVAPIFTPAGRRTQWTTELLARPLPGHDDLYLEATFDRITAVHGPITSGRFGMSLYASQFRLAPAVRFTRSPDSTGAVAGGSFVSLNAYSLPFAALGPLLGTVSMRAAWEMDGGGHTTVAAAYLSRNLGRSVRIEGGMAWNRGVGTTFSLFLSTQLRSVRATTTVTAPTRGPASASQFFQGSIAYDPGRGGVAFAVGPLLQRAGLSGRVFLDENEDGRWQRGEPLLPGVRVRAGFTSAVSDSAGEYRVWNLPSFEPVLVAVDSATLDSPLWVPAYGSISIETGPNRFRGLDVPIVPGGVIEGRVVRRSVSGLVPVPGARLLLRHRASGDTRTLTTFSDGDFYLMGVRSGAYELSVDPDALAGSGLTGAPITFTLPAAADGAAVDGLELRLQ